MENASAEAPSVLKTNSTKDYEGSLDPLKNSEKNIDHEKNSNFSKTDNSKNPDSSTPSSSKSNKTPKTHSSKVFNKPKQNLSQNSENSALATAEKRKNSSPIVF